MKQPIPGIYFECKHDETADLSVDPAMPHSFRYRVKYICDRCPREWTLEVKDGQLHVTKRLTKDPMTGASA